MAALSERFNEHVSESLKVTNLVGMLPREFQDMDLQNGVRDSELRYTGSRDFVIQVANHKTTLVNPGDTGLNVLDHGHGNPQNGIYCDEYDLDAIGKGGGEDES